jgi:chromate transporter
MTDVESARPSLRRTGEVVLAFAKLGVTSFGGPIAHLGYFRAELVERRKWVSEKDYADLVALCQFLPGPASSQVGFSLGLARAGFLGALAAFVAFTLPSAVLLVAFGLGATFFDGPVAAGVLSGLNIVAVAIVAQAILGMARALILDWQRAAIALAAVVLALLLPGSWGQIGALVLGAVGGMLLSRRDDGPVGGLVDFRVSRTVGIVSLALFVILLGGLPLLGALGLEGFAVLDAFYRSGALVFGGGHVVLPLLQSAVVDPGWVSQSDFLAGYGAAQAVPGPLFTFAGYLGAILGPEPHGITGAVVALIGVFLPGFLLLIGVLPFWNSLRTRRNVRALMRGANAAVVGILAAAFCTPIFPSAITGVPQQFALALMCFLCLVGLKTPPWLVVIIGAMGGLAIAAAGGFA